ncbi:conserved hypothetical protein [Leishmania major strain Friedlin]|uniref:Uncharacterized protein n=1 Tax=Leishmania major TaxID=5664 RepID=E9AEB5_LEIMA|nr:conserved hypothetical protein [Leishmania major strain Friedlin]CAG9577994.1 hypothetical_protein_-_conserved [Leishmania major strain Friedlin]CBZ12594.1 conserved hypothetical protein [Leishmania major strain Friedlin]|eukprot:XP_003722336.1 conserved hypothetical protein [Leishmania major strain Friedlin]
MKKSISLKEFSTTPTVSYMLSKDGHNVAAAADAQSRSMNLPPQPLRVERPKQQQPVPDSDDTMYEME